MARASYIHSIVHVYCINYHKLVLVEGDEMETIEVDSNEDSAGDETPQVYLPGQQLDEGEELIHDSSAYHMYYAVSACVYTAGIYVCII